MAVLFEDENGNVSPAGAPNVLPKQYPLPAALRRKSSIEWQEDNFWATSQGAQNAAPVEPKLGDEMIDQLSARVGSFQIAEDGQLRYFGATSNLHILHNGAASLSRAPTRSVQVEGKRALQRAEIGEDVPRAFESHLEKLYFTWEDPAIHVVDEEMYYHEKARYEEDEDSGTSFYSESLKNAMFVVSLIIYFKC